jgi:hypothetical protein
MNNTNWKISLATNLSLLIITMGGFAMSGLAVAAEDEEDSDDSGDAKQKPGYYTESFHIMPELQLTGYNDDNIYATDLLQESDYVAIISPMVKIKSLWDKHRLNLNAGANLGRYAENSDENYNDAWLEADGSFALGDSSSLFGGAGYSHKHEPRDSKESTSLGVEPTTYDVTDLRLGLRQGYGDLTLRVAGTYQALDYDNVERIGGGTVDNSDRDRSVGGLGARVSQRLDKNLSIYLQAFLNNRDYDEAMDQFGFDRDSKGYTASFGATKKFGRNNKIDAYLGWLVQDYDDYRFEQVSTPNFAASLRWYPAASYKLTASLDRTLSETTEYASSGYLYTRFDTQLDKRMFNNIVGYLSYGYGLVDYQDVGREDVINSFGVGINYYMSKRVLISGGYTYINNDSNDESEFIVLPEDTYDYTRNLLLISVKVKL